MMIKHLVVITLSLALAACASSKPEAPVPPSIGAARMLPNGVIHMQLRAEIDSAIGDAFIVVKPGDPIYEEIRAHVGGLKPGEEKPVPPWDNVVSPK